VGFSKFHKFVLFASHGRFMNRLGRYPVLVLHTKGRVTGKIRKTPLIYMNSENGYVCVGSFGGSPKHPDWVINLQNDSEVVVEICGEKILATGEFVSGSKRTILWEQLVNFYPGFGYYQSVTFRCIPVVNFLPKTKHE